MDLFDSFSQTMKALGAKARLSFKRGEGPKPDTLLGKENSIFKKLRCYDDW
jgi:hypothetical protein